MTPTIEVRRRSLRFRCLAPVAMVVSAIVFVPIGQAHAAPLPAWRIAAVSGPTDLPPGGDGIVAVFTDNIGGAPAGGPLDPIKVEDTLPPGLRPTSAASAGVWSCGISGPLVSCEATSTIQPGTAPPPIEIAVEVIGAAGAEANTATISGGGAEAASTAAELTISSTPAAAGVQAFQAGAYDEEGHLDARAGDHPFQASTAIFLNTVVNASGKIVPAGDPREIEVGLPPGFIGNPLAAPRCPLEGGNTECPEGTKVGIAKAIVGSFANKGEIWKPGELEAVYNDAPGFGSPAEFSFATASFKPIILADLRSDSDYGVTVASRNTPQIKNLYGALFTFCSRGAVPDLGGVYTSGCRTATDPEADSRPLLTNPANCSEEAAASPLTELAVNTWQEPARFSESRVVLPPVTDCAALAGHFRPTFSFRPEVHSAASPSPFVADLEIPQEGLTEPEGLAAPDLKKAVVTLPRGVDVNPASANGLEACSEAQMGLTTTSGAAPNPIRFDKSEPSCPEASKLGTVEAKSPLVEETLGGTIYLAAQEENPFHSLLAIYAVIDSPRNGILVKLPGEVRPDPTTGQLTATFDDNPQLPVEDLKLNFRGGGPQSPVSTPAVCGNYATHGELTPWSAPESGPPAQTEDSFQVTSGPGGGGCVTSEAGLPFAPSFEAGTSSTQAGAYAPLVVKVGRRDGEQELTRLNFTLPPGLLGKLAGIPYCPDAAIEAARGKSGKAEQASPSCPAALELGTVDTSAGVGSEPIHVGGRVYLAGPYKGAPLSAVVITPAVAGPFDLGTVVVRAALRVNPETAQITAQSDEVPHILKGIPLQLRSVEIKVSRDGFTLNPTSCNPMAVSASLGGLNGGSAAPSNRFQVGGCSSLPFKPQLKLSVIGKTNRNAKPRLKAVLTTRSGEANIRRAQVNLPHSEFLEQDHIKTVCTRVQWAEGDGNGSACPKGSIYGKAKAWTPLLDHPLEGYVYLRSSSHKLPDLVAALDGQIDIALDGNVDSGPNRGIRNTFEVVPDAPVSRFVLELFGKKKGILVNSESLCSPAAKRHAIVRLTGQNGKVRAFKPIVTNQCKKAKKGTKKAKSKKSR